MVHGLIAMIFCRESAPGAMRVETPDSPVQAVFLRDFRSERQLLSAFDSWSRFSGKLRQPSNIMLMAQDKAEQLE